MNGRMDRWLNGWKDDETKLPQARDGISVFVLIWAGAESLLLTTTLPDNNWHSGERLVLDAIG